MEEQKKKVLKQIFRSGILRSFFGTLKNADFEAKSKIQRMQIIEKSEQIDEATFRLMKNYQRPQKYIVYEYYGKCYLSKEASLFSCFFKRKTFDLRLENSRLAMTEKNNIVKFVDFNAISCNIENRKDSFQIFFKGSEDAIYIEPLEKKNKTNEEETESWVKLLNQVIENSEGKNNGYCFLAQKIPNFFRLQHILDREFEENTNSGDILLFQSEYSEASLKRIYGSRDFDHVGVVLRNRKNEIFVLESTQTNGVGLTPWKDLIKFEWYSQVKKICWRPLFFNIREEQIQIFQSFILKTLGKSFEINLEKIFKAHSTLKRSSQEESKKTYFSSELIARLYKQLGLINEERSSTSYFPIDFSSIGSIQITKPGVSLGNQKIISFDGVKP